MSQYVALDHPKFQRAELAVFTSRVVADCMSHRCAMVATGAEKLDACCQHGCDVDLYERRAIEQHADEIRRVLRADVRALRWFDDDDPEPDPDAPTLYRVTRDALAFHFGDALVRACDAAEARVLGRRLPTL